MWNSRVVVLALLAVLLTCGAAAEEDASSTFRQLLTWTEKGRQSEGRNERTPQARSARLERRTHLSEDEREIMTKQIMQAISEIMNSECMMDRDYQGWVDFGRRDAE